MALETRYFSRISPSTPSQIIYEDIGINGNNQDQIVIQTQGISAFSLAINDDALTNGGNYAAAFLVTIDGSVSEQQTFAYIDFTNFAFAAAASELADYYSSLGYVVYDDDTSFRARINAAPNEQFTVTLSGSLHDNAGEYAGGAAHAVSYTAQVSEQASYDGGLNYGTDFRDINPFSSVGSFFDGRGDLDVVTFQNSSSAYQIDVRDNNRAIVNGVDIINTERLDFADRTLALDIDGTAGSVYRLYQAAFDRQPDFGGLSANVEFVDDGMTMRRLAEHFAASPEFNSLYGSNSSNNTFLQAVYDNVFDRNPDASGYQYWNGQLENGMSRGEVLLRMSDSPENIAIVAPAIDNGIWLA